MTKPRRSAVPPIDSDRIAFQHSSPTGNPDEWGSVQVGDNGYERYEDEYEEYSCAVFDGTADLLIDGEIVHSLGFSLYQGGGDETPDSDPIPNKHAVYKSYLESLQP